jgi:hypothetical protein
LLCGLKEPPPFLGWALKSEKTELVRSLCLLLAVYFAADAASLNSNVITNIAGIINNILNSD